MEWLSCIKEILEHIEDNLLDDISLENLAKKVYLSPMFLEKGFSIMTGYSIGEYIRNRRLYEAAIEVLSSDQKIIDIAYKYRYETPESFTKAFDRFHGATPKEIRNKTAPIVTFIPLKINISISGGHTMKYTIKNFDGFKVIGFFKKIRSEEALEKIPQFWDEVFEKYVKNINKNNKANNDYEEAIINNHIGEFGICIDDNEQDEITYLIAGKYEGGNVPKGMMVYELRKGDWAIFDCIGPMPKAIQEVNRKIYQEWLPLNPVFELDGNASVEWYDPKMFDNQAENYHSAVYIPVKKIKK